jgi:hypothetical protein
VHWAFEITSGWRKNVFKLPKGSAGKHFTQALSKLYLSYAERTALECVSLKAASIIVPLLLQQPASKTSYKENKEHLQRRLSLWHDGNIRELIREGQSIQDRLIATPHNLSDAVLAKRFATMVFNNNFKGAMSLILEKGKGGILALNDETKTEMRKKHPNPEPMIKEVLLSGPMPPSVHPVIYDAIDAETIKKLALRTSGRGGFPTRGPTLACNGLRLQGYLL